MLNPLLLHTIIALLTSTLHSYDSAAVRGFIPCGEHSDQLHFYLNTATYVADVLEMHIPYVAYLASTEFDHQELSLLRGHLADALWLKDQAGGDLMRLESMPF